MRLLAAISHQGRCVGIWIITGVTEEEQRSLWPEPCEHAISRQSYEGPGTYDACRVQGASAARNAAVHNRAGYFKKKKSFWTLEFYCISSLDLL